MPVNDPQALATDRVEAIRRYHQDTGIERAQLDVSGGVDSAVMLGLLVLALGADNVTAVYQGIQSSEESLDRAREAAEAFGVPLIELDLTQEFRQIVSEVWKRVAAAHGSEAIEEADARREADATIDGSLRSCIRAPVGRYVNRFMGGGIRHGTGNECEDRWTRFFNKGGDGEVDSNPLAMLSKGEVYQLALQLGVPRSVIEARPSPDLWGDGEAHNDEDEFASYFRFKPPEGIAFYSYIDVETGEYRNVGLIERVSRFLDGVHLEHDDGAWARKGYVRGVFTVGIEGVLFQDGDPIPPAALDMLHEEAEDSGLFDGLQTAEIATMLGAARRIERATRHKMNPNCPTLGTRADLVEAGILTDTLPL
jgi:NAD+ synthetase